MTTLRFAECQRLLEKGRDGRKKLDNNTYLHQIDKDTFGVKLHDTFVVKIHSNDTYTLDSGGWQTPTTKDRINNYGPARIYQSKGIWYFVDRQLFADGCVVDASGNRIDKAQISVEKTEKLKAKLDRMVSKYIKGFIEHLMTQTDGLTRPSNGDCWGCLMRKADKQETKVGSFRTKRASVKDSEAMGLDHLFDHFREKYYVPSLLFKAIEERGYNDPVFIWQYIEMDVKQGRKPDHAAQALRQYFTRRKPELMKLMK